MSTTFGALKTAISAALRDPSNKTFPSADVGDLINTALAEVGRIVPEQFQEDITLVADTLVYTPRVGVFGVPVSEIEISRVELWDTTPTPDVRYWVIPAASAGYVADSQTGWSMWGGKLYLPNSVYAVFQGQESRFLVRVWGYSPYVQWASDATVITISDEIRWALYAYCKAEALTSLLAERDLFTQWQAKSNNSDVSPAALMNMLNIAREDWRRRSRSLQRLRARV